jgi:KEOPS complex subunit Cgi121
MPFVAMLAKGTVDDVQAAVAVTEQTAKRHNVFAQLIDPRIVFNERHLQSAQFHATRAFEQKRESAHSFGAEFLLYLTGQRQVSRALELAGIKKGAEATIIVADGERAGTVLWGVLDKLGWSRDPKGIPENREAVMALGIAAPPDGALEDAVLEKVALVDVIK